MNELAESNLAWDAMTPEERAREMMEDSSRTFEEELEIDRVRQLWVRLKRAYEAEHRLRQAGSDQGA